MVIKRLHSILLFVYSSLFRRLKRHFSHISWIKIENLRRNQNLSYTKLPPFPDALTFARSLHTKEDVICRLASPFISKYQHYCLFFPPSIPFRIFSQVCFSIERTRKKKWGKNNIYSFYIHLDHDLQDLSLRNKEAPHSDKKRKKALKMSPLKDL